MYTKCSGTVTKVILIKTKQAVQTNNLSNFYGDDFQVIGLPDKTTATERKEIIKDLEGTLPSTCKCILCADTEMFKTLTGVKKVSGYDGYPTNSPLGDVFIIPNYVSIFYNPEVQHRLDFIMDKVNSYIAGNKVEIGVGIIESHKFVTDPNEVTKALDELLAYDALTIDIETAIKPENKDKVSKGALRHPFNYIVSIGFAWDKHNGTVILVNDNKDILKHLARFFGFYLGKTIYHNSGFDITQLIYHCFMKNLTDYEGMLRGLHTMCKNFEDTKHIAYLCLNSCGSPELGLKPLSHEYCGNYAQDEIADCSAIPVDQLMMYNLTDCCATWYVYDKYKPMLKTENQEEIYYDLFLSSQKVLIETQLVGLRINISKTCQLYNKLEKSRLELYSKLENMPIVKRFTDTIRHRIVTEYNNTHKKQINSYIELLKLAGYKSKLKYNPSSDTQTRELLYTVLQLPVIDMTNKGLPSVSAKTFKKLVHTTTNQEIIDLLNLLMEISSIDIIFTTFMPSFMEAPEVEPNKNGIYGSFNLGGTVSGRLSSSNP